MHYGVHLERGMLKLLVVMSYLHRSLSMHSIKIIHWEGHENPRCTFIHQYLAAASAQEM